MNNDDLKVRVIQICKKDGEVLITKIDPVYEDYDWLIEKYTLKCEDVIKRFEDILTEEDKIKLRNTI